MSIRMEHWYGIGVALLLAVGPSAVADNKAEGKKPVSQVQREGQQSRAEERLRKLADEGDKAAQMQLGEACLLGKMGIERDPKEALSWLRKAACEDKRSKRKKQKPEPRAFLLLGRCYEREDYAEFLKLKKSNARALEYYRMAEKYGYTPAAFDVAITLRRLGRTAEAVAYFKKAADADIQPAQVEYGYILVNGLGVKANPTAAVPYLTKAAKSGSSDAQLLLAEVFGGKYPGIQRNPKKMVDYLWQAAMTRPEAIARIGYCYQHGIGLPRDPTLAVRWYMRAAQADPPSPEAIIALASCTQKGVGTEKNESQALALYLKASTMDGVPSMVFHNIGTCYAKGIGTEKDESKAFAFFKQAADLKVAASMNAMGELYESGTAIDPDSDKKVKDLKRAFEWYAKAAEAKHPRGLYNLGRCYLKGIGVEADREKAQLLLKQGIQGGVKDTEGLYKGKLELPEKKKVKDEAEVLENLPKTDATAKPHSTLKGF